MGRLMACISIPFGHEALESATDGSGAQMECKRGVLELGLEGHGQAR